MAFAGLQRKVVENPSHSGQGFIVWKAKSKSCVSGTEMVKRSVESRKQISSDSAGTVPVYFLVAAKLQIDQSPYGVDKSGSERRTNNV